MPNSTRRRERIEAFPGLTLLPVHLYDWRIQENNLGKTKVQHATVL